MELAHPIPQLNMMRFAGLPAVLNTRSITQEGAENTVLHMKHRHVLVDGQFQPIRGRLFQHLAHLPFIEVVGNGEVFKASALHQKFRS